jgi:hypothetical protein
VAGAADGVADGGDGATAEGDGIGAGGVGGAAASPDGREICSLTDELVDDIAVSALRRAPSKYPETCWLRVATARKP